MSEGANAILLDRCEVIKHEVSKNLNNRLVDQSSEFENNKAYLYQHLKGNENSSKDD